MAEVLQQSRSQGEREFLDCVFFSKIPFFVNNGVFWFESNDA